MIWAISILMTLIFITYLVFPFMMLLLGSFIKEQKTEALNSTHRVFLLMAAHNEEAIISEKLDSIVSSNFNHKNLICYIGSDASTDRTNEIIKSYADKINLHFIAFKSRHGKPAIINSMVEEIQSSYQVKANDLFLLTDSNVIFHQDFISEITSSFSNLNIGLVDSNIVNLKSEKGVGQSESQYLRLESKIKQAEGKLFGCSMGPFGGAFMMRANLYVPVPKNFLVDDFFIFFNVLKERKVAIFNEEAICYESVSGSFKEEFRRKIRISAGNFQNTIYFLPYFIRIWKTHNIIFILHKLLRWLSPIFLIGIIVIAGIGSAQQPLLGKFAVIIISLLVGIPLINYLLNRVNLKFKWLQGLSYLIMMNLALLIGFIKFLKGIRTNVWEPTKRKIRSEYR